MKNTEVYWFEIYTFMNQFSYAEVINISITYQCQSWKKHSIKTREYSWVKNKTEMLTQAFNKTVLVLYTKTNKHELFKNLVSSI